MRCSSKPSLILLILSMVFVINEGSDKIDKIIPALRLAMIVSETASIWRSE